MKKSDFTFRCTPDVSPQTQSSHTKPPESADLPLNVGSVETRTETILQSRRPEDIATSLECLRLDENSADRSLELNTNVRSLAQPDFVEETVGTTVSAVTAPPLNPYNDTHYERRPYDIRTEPFPDTPFYDTGFQSTLKEGVKIARDAAVALEGLSASSRTPHLQNLASTAQALSNYRSDDTRTIGILGDSGEGKSSTINSLLHNYPEIARTGDSGSACTSVVTEYRQRKLQHTAPIAIEIEHLSPSGIKELIEELVWNYRKLYLPTVENDETTVEQYNRYQRESELAWAALESAFKHKGGFKEDFLRDMSDGAVERINDTLIGWTEDICWPKGGGSLPGIWGSTADTAEECSEKTAEFMQDRLWPFTKVIRVYLDSPVLKTGIILADLPGLQDTNLARVKTTQDYLLRCDHVFIVTKISRAITDQSLKSSLYHVLTRHVPLEWEDDPGRYLNVAVVCTKTEDINETTARRDFCGQNKPITLETIKDMDREIEAAKKGGDRKGKKRLERKRRFLLIDARNDMVKKGLQNSYTAKVPTGVLEVFCVSNTTYDKYARKGDLDMVKASGIPELRSFCYSITAKKQLSEAKYFLSTRLGAMLNSVDLWANSYERAIESLALRPKVMVDKDFKSLKNHIRGICKEAPSTFKGSVQEQLLQYTARLNENWEHAAEARERLWHSWHWTQYNAWCLNDGDHSTPKRGSVNWNRDLLWKMRSELDMPWSLLDDDVSEIFDDLQKKLGAEMDGFKSRLKASSRGSASYVSTLMALLRESTTKSQGRQNKPAESDVTGTSRGSNLGSSLNHIHFEASWSRNNGKDPGHADSLSGSDGFKGDCSSGNEENSNRRVSAPLVAPDFAFRGPYIERYGYEDAIRDIHQHICASSTFKRFSPEELRLLDYLEGRGSRDGVPHPSTSATSSRTHATSSDDAQCLPSSLSKALESIDFHTRAIRYQVNTLKEYVRRELNIIRRKASDGAASSYVVQEMRPAYRAASAQSGTGKAERQRNLVHGQITKGHLFPKISITVEEKITKLYRRAFRNLETEVLNIVGQIKCDLDMAFGEAAEQDKRPELDQYQQEVIASFKQLSSRYKKVVSDIALVP